MIPAPPELVVIRDPPRSGAANMAADEALLARAEPPTLRFYGWDPPALSLGRFQGPLDLPGLPPGANVVRRITGGGAIWHQDELTFCLVLPRERFPWAANPLRLYAATNRVWRAALARLGVRAEEGRAPESPCGPGLCFDRRERTDLLAGGRKILGSAQRRAARAILIHGSLPLRRNPLARGAISLAEAAGREVPAEEVIGAFLAVLADGRPVAAPSAF